MLKSLSKIVLIVSEWCHQVSVVQLHLMRFFILMFADNTVLLADSEENLQRLLYILEKYYETVNT